MNKKYILFDLDGTVTDSREGITKCVSYALKSFGIEEDDMTNLLNYIGPPLIESFQKFHGLSLSDAKQAVAKYRERYTDIGIYENKLFDGIYDLIKELKKDGKIIALATCKPEPYAKRIIEYFELTDFFDVVAGSNMDGTRQYKSEVIDEALSRIVKINGVTDCSEKEFKEYLNEIKADSVMIGDRKDDILGARTCRIESIGVRYGFAKENELEDAGADYIINSPDEILELLANKDNTTV